MFFKKVFVPWLLLFTTVSPNTGWVLAGVSKADYHTQPSFLRNKISTEEMGNRWDVCLCLGENRGGPPRWKGQDEQREGGRDRTWPEQERELIGTGLCHPWSVRKVTGMTRSQSCWDEKSWSGGMTTGQLCLWLAHTHTPGRRLATK